MRVRSQTIPISSRFKGLINFLCDVFKIKPLFIISDSSIVDRIKDYKNKISLIQQEEEPDPAPPNQQMT